MNPLSVHGVGRRLGARPSIGSSRIHGRPAGDSFADRDALLLFATKQEREHDSEGDDVQTELGNWLVAKSQG